MLKIISVYLLFVINCLASNDLELEIVASKEVFLLGEPISFVVTIANKTNKKVFVPISPWSRGNLTFQGTVNGDVLHQRSRPNVSSRASMPAIEPAGELTFKLFPSIQMHMEEEGSYVVRVAINSSVVDADDPSSQSDLSYSTELSFDVVSLSEEGIITITDCFEPWVDGLNSDDWMIQSESALALTSTFSPIAVRHFSQSAKNTDNPYGVIVSTYCLALMRDESSTIEVIEDLLKSNNPDILDDLIYSISAFDRTEFSDALQSLTKTELLLNNDKLMEQTLKALSRLARASVTN